MKQYLDLLNRILNEGVDKTDRTGTGTRSIFGHQMRFDLSKGFPLLTTKKLPFRIIAHELLWLLSGDTNIKYLHDNNVHIWDSWKRPYTLQRKIVNIAPKIATYPNQFNSNDIVMNHDMFDGIERRLAMRWKLMMVRCYDNRSEKFSMYGAKGVTVHPDWHDPICFMKEVKEIPHWEYAKDDLDHFELDKDYFGAFQYGKNTSIWLRHDENIQYMSTLSPVRVSSENFSRIFISSAQAGYYYSIPTSTMKRFLDNPHSNRSRKGKNSQFNGWKFERLSDRSLRLEQIKTGDLGPIYGKQWRSWTCQDGKVIDQLIEVVNSIKNNPDSRRHIVTSWNPSDIPEMALPPCHCFFQFYVANGKLSCQLYQRSGDAFLGIPFNIASYALLTHMIAAITDLEPGEFIHTIGDAHIYHNHLPQVIEQLQRDPRKLPEIWINRGIKDIDSFGIDDFKITGYDPHPHIKGEVSV